MSSVDGAGNNTSTINQTENADGNFSNTLANTNAATTTSADQTQSANTTTQQNTSVTPIQAADLGDPVVETVTDDASVIAVFDYVFHLDYRNPDILPLIHPDALEQINNQPGAGVPGLAPDRVGTDDQQTTESHGTNMLDIISETLHENASPELIDNIKLMPVVLDQNERITLDQNGELTQEVIDNYFFFPELVKIAEAKEAFNRGEAGGIKYTATSISLGIDRQMLNGELKIKGIHLSDSEFDDVVTAIEERYGDILERLDAAGVNVINAAGNFSDDTRADDDHGLYIIGSRTLAESSNGFLTGAVDENGEIIQISNRGEFVDFYTSGSKFDDIDGLPFHEEKVGTSNTAPKFAALVTMLAESSAEPLSPSERIQIIRDGSAPADDDPEGVHVVNVGKIFNDFTASDTEGSEIASSVTLSVMRDTHGSIVVTETHNVAGREHPIVRKGFIDNYSEVPREGGVNVYYSASSGEVEDGFAFQALRLDTDTDPETGEEISRVVFTRWAPDGIEAEDEIAPPTDIIFNGDPAEEPSQGSVWQRRVDTYTDGREVVSTLYGANREDGTLDVVQSKTDDGKVTVSSPLWGETYTYKVPEGAIVYPDLPSITTLTTETELAALETPHAAFDFLHGHNISTAYTPEIIEGVFGPAEDSAAETATENDKPFWEKAADTFLDLFKPDSKTTANFVNGLTAFIPNAFGESEEPQGSHEVVSYDPAEHAELLDKFIETSKKDHPTPNIAHLMTWDALKGDPNAHPDFLLDVATDAEGNKVVKGALYFRYETVNDEPELVVSNVESIGDQAGLRLLKEVAEKAHSANVPLKLTSTNEQIDYYLLLGFEAAPTGILSKSMTLDREAQVNFLNNFDTFANVTGEYKSLTHQAKALKGAINSVGGREVAPNYLIDQLKEVEQKLENYVDSHTKDFYFTPTTIEVRPSDEHYLNGPAGSVDAVEEYKQLRAKVETDGFENLNSEDQAKFAEYQDIISENRNKAFEDTEGAHEIVAYDPVKHGDLMSDFIERSGTMHDVEVASDWEQYISNQVRYQVFVDVVTDSNGNKVIKGAVNYYQLGGGSVPAPHLYLALVESQGDQAGLRLIKAIAEEAHNRGLPLVLAPRDGTEDYYEFLGFEYLGDDRGEYVLDREAQEELFNEFAQHSFATIKLNALEKGRRLLLAKIQTRGVDHQDSQADLEELEKIDEEIERLEDNGAVEGTEAGLGFADEGVGSGSGTQASGTGATGTTAPSLNPLGYALALVGGSILKPASVAADAILNLGQGQGQGESESDGDNTLPNPVVGPEQPNFWTDLQDAVSGFEKTLKDIDQNIRDAGQGFLEFTQETQAATANFFKDVFGIKDDEAAEDGQAAPDTFFGLPIPVLPPIIPQIFAEPDTPEVQGPGDFSKVDFNNLAGSLPFMGTLATAMTNATGGNATYTGDLNIFERFDTTPIGLVGGNYNGNVHLWLPGVDLEDGEFSSMYFGGPVLPGEGAVKHIPNVKILDDGRFGLSHALVFSDVGDRHTRAMNPFVAFNVISSDEQFLTELANVVGGDGDIEAFMAEHSDAFDQVDISIVPGVIGDPVRVVRGVGTTAGLAEETLDFGPRLGVGAAISLDSPLELQRLLVDGVLVDPYGNEIPLEDLADYMPEEAQTALEVAETVNEQTPTALVEIFNRMAEATGKDDPTLIPTYEEIVEAAKEDGQTQAGWFLAYDNFLKGITSDFNGWINGTKDDGSLGSNATVGTVREAAQGELLANWDKLSPSQKLLMHANSAYYRDLGIALGPLSATEEKILLQFNQTSSSGDFSIASFDDIEGFYEAVEKLEEQEEAEEKQAEQLEKVHETLKGLGPILTEIYNGERAPLGEGRTDITATVIQGVPEGFKKTTGFENYVTSVDKEGNVKLGHAAGLVDWAAFGKLLQEIAEGNASGGSGSTSGGSGPAGVSGLSEQDVALSSDLATVLLGVTSDGRLVLDTSVLEDNKLVDHISGLISGDEGPSWGSTEAVEALKKRILLSFENEGAVSDVDLDPAATALREALVLDEASLKDMTAEEFAERIDDGLKKKAQEERNAFWDALHGGEDPAKGFVYERPVNVAVAMDGLAALDGLQMGGVSVDMARGLFGVMAEARVQSASGTSANFSVNASSLGWQTFKGVEHTNALSSETLAAMKEAFSRISVPRQQLAWAFEVAQDKAGFDKQVADLDLEIRELQDRIDSARNSGGKWSDKTPEQHAAASAARTERREKMEALSAEREALQEKKEAYDEVWERKGAALSDLRALLSGMSSVILGLEGLLAANSEIVGTDAQIEHLLLGLDDLETNLVNEGLRMSASSGEFSAVRDGLIGQFMFGAAYQESEVTSFDFINADWQQRMSSPGYWAQMGKMETEMDHLKDFMVLVQEEHDKLEEIRKEWFMASPNKNLLNKYRDELAEIRTKQIGILEAAKAAAGDNPTYQAVLDIQIKDIEGRMSELSKSWKRETASNQRRQAHESLQEAKGTYKEYEKDFDALTQNYFAGDAERQDGQRVSALQKAVYSLLEAYMAGEDVSEDMGADVQALMDGLMVAMEKTDGKLARLNQALSGGDELRASMLDYALDKAAGQAMQAEMAGMFTTPGEGSEATTTYLDLLKEKQNLEAQVSGLDTQIDGFYGTKEGNYELTGQIYDASSYLSAQGSGAIDLLTVGDHRAALIEERQAAQAADPNLVLPPLEEALGLRLERDYLEKLPEGVAASARVRSLESQIANHIKYMDQQQKDGKYKNTGSGKARKNKDTNTLHGLQDQLVAAKKDVIGKEALLHQAVRNLIEHGGEGTLFNIFGDVQADETITPASALETVLAELTVISPQHAQLRVQLNTAQSRVAQAQHMVDNTSGSQRTTWRGELKKRQDSLEVVEGRLAPFEAELAKREELLAGREAFLAAQAEGQEPDAEQLQAWAATFAGLLERLEDKMIASQGTLRSNIGPVLPHLDDPATAQWHWDSIDDTANVTSSIEGAYVALLALQGLEQEAKGFLKTGLDAYQTETMTAWGVAEGERTKAKAQLSLIERQLAENHNWVDVKASYAQAEAEVDGLKLKLDGPEDDSAPAEIGTLAGLEADQHRELSLQGDRLNLLSGLKAVGEDTSEALAAELAAVKEKHATLTTQLNTAKGRLASAERALESWKDARSSTQRNSAVRTWTDEVKGRKESVAVYEARLAPVDAQLKELETVLAERGSPDAQLATLTAQVDKLIAVYEDEQAELEGKLAELANYPPEYLEGLDVWVDWRVSIAKSSSKITRAKYDAPLKEAEAFIAEVNALVADAGPRVAAQIAELKELKAGLSGQSTPEAALAWAENTLKAGITAGAEAIDTVETQISTTLSSELSGTQWEQEQVLANREKVAAHQQVLKDQEASMLAGLQGLKFESVDELYLHVHEAVALETEIKAAELEVKTLEQRAYDLSVDGRRTRADFTSEKQAWKGEKSATDAALAEAQAKLSGLQAKRVGNNDLAGSLNIQWGSVAHTVVALEGTLAGFARPETDARVEVHDFAGGLGDWRLVETLSTASGSKGGYTATAVEGGSVQISGDGNKVHANLAHKMDLSDLSGDEVTFTADFDFQGHASYSTARLLIKDGVTGQTLKQSLLANKEFGSFEGRQVTIDRSVLDGARDLSNVVVEVGLYDSHGANLGESLTLHNLSWEYTGDGSHGLKAAFDETLASHQDAVADEQSMYAGFVTNYEGKAAVLAETRVGLESDMAAATARYDAVHYTYADYESVYMQLQESEASATRFADLMEAHYTTLDNDPENDETRHFWLSPEAALQNIFEQSDAGASNEASADWAAFALGNFDTLTELRLGMADLGLEVSVKNSEAGRRIVTPAHDDPGSVFGDLAFLRHQLLNSGEGLSLQEMQAVETGLNLTILKAFADAGYFEAERVALEGHPKAAQIATLDEQLAETAYGVVHEDTGGKVHTDEFHRIIDVSDLQGDRLVVDFDLQGVAQDRNPSRAVIVVKNVEDGSTLLSTQINAPLAGTTDWQHTQLDLSALPHGKPLDLEGVDQVVIEVRTDFGAQVKGLTVSGHQHKLQGAERAKALADRDALIESSDNWGWQLDIAESRSELQAKRDELQAEYDAAPTEALAHELAHLDAQLTKALDDGIRAQVQELFADLGLEEGKPLGALDLRKTGMLSHLDTEVFVMDSELPPERRSDASSDEKFSNLNGFLLRNLEDGVNGADVLKGVQEILGGFGKGRADKNKKLVNYKAFQEFENISLTEGITDEITASRAHLDQSVARYGEKHKGLMGQRENVVKAQADPMVILERSIGQMDLRYMMPASAKLVATNDADDTTTEDTTSDDTETADTETESPLTLSTMSLADILANEDLQKLLGIENPIIISNTETDNANTNTENETAETEETGATEESASQPRHGSHNFADGLGAWSSYEIINDGSNDHGGASRNDYVTEVVDGGVRISGDGYRTQSGVETTLDLSDWTGDLTFTVDLSTQSGTTLSSVTNAYLVLLDAASGEFLTHHAFVEGGVTTYDSNNQAVTISRDAIAQETLGDVTVRVAMVDNWATNWNQALTINSISWDYMSDEEAQA